jgi:RNA-directed DNA polymerase
MNKSKIAWNTVKWSIVNRRIKVIQRRIYEACKEGHRGKIIFLQDLLINSLDAKLLAVRRVTTENKGKWTAGLDGKIYDTPEKKALLVEKLKIDGKAVPIRRVFIPKPGKVEKRPLGIPIILDRAKQKLVLMALEPEWEAKFEANSYGFRPGRCTKDATEAIFLCLRNHKGDNPMARKYIIDADLKGCFDNIDHDYLLKKLDTNPLIEIQVKAWLKAGIFEGLKLSSDKYDEVLENQIGTPQGGVISPFLANVALHGMENHLKEWIVNQTWAVEKRHELYKVNKIKSIALIRYADDFVIIHKDKEILKMAKEEISRWLSNTSKLKFNEDKTRIIDSFQGFKFLGFQIININRGGITAAFHADGTKFRRVKVYPSAKNFSRFIEKIGDTCRKLRSVSSYMLIEALRPKILGWGNYFRHCECKEAFNKMDKDIFNILRAWVFRRDKRSSRTVVKEKYFPSGESYSFENRTYNNNWVLVGQTKEKNGILKKNYLPKLSWIQSKKIC